MKKELLFVLILMLVFFPVMTAEPGPAITMRPGIQIVPAPGTGDTNFSATNESMDLVPVASDDEISIVTDKVTVHVPKKSTLVNPESFGNITDSKTRSSIVSQMTAAVSGGNIYQGLVYRDMTTDLPNVNYVAFCADKGGARPEFSYITWVWINDYNNYGGYSPGHSYQINHTYYPPWENTVPDGGAVKLYLYCNNSGGQFYGAYNMTTLPPVADFTANVTTGPVPLVVNLTDISLPPPATRLWSFGDGGTSTDSAPVHAFTSPGIYNVSLTVANAGGNDTKIRAMTVTGSGPVQPGEYILIANFSQANNWGGAAVSNHHIGGVSFNNWTNVSKLVVDGHFYDYGVGSDTCSGNLQSYPVPKTIGTFTHSYTTNSRNSYAAEAHLEYMFAWTSNPDPGTTCVIMVNDDCSNLASFSGGTMTRYPPYGPNRANVGSIGSLSDASVKVYGPPHLSHPLANFTAAPVSGPTPLTVNFTDTSTNSPTSWSWSFGDGGTATTKNPSHEYSAAGTYSVALNVSNAGGWNRTVKTGYVGVMSPVACDATGPYVDFVIENVSCPERNSGVWYGAVCVDNAMIRWALAGKSTPFYANLSPLKWKRNLVCPNPGHSWAVDSPYNKPIYFVAVENSDTANVYYFSHAVAAEYLATGDVRSSTWHDWKFFNYNDLDIQIGPGSQIPSGTQISNTTVTIKNITRVYSCGQRDSTIVRSFTIDLNNGISPIPAQSYPQGSIVSKTGKTFINNQDIPDDLKNELRLLNDNGLFTISKWEFDPTSKELVVYAYDIGKLQMIDGIHIKSVGEFSVRMIHDMEFEKNRTDTRQQLGELMKNSDYQIASIDMTTDTLNDPPENYVELWVYKSTPENKKLNNTVMNGWKILVYPVSPPPSDNEKSLKKEIIS